MESCCDHVLIYDGDSEDGIFIEDVHAPVDPEESWHAESGSMYLRMETDFSVAGDNGYSGFIARVQRQLP